MTTEQINNIFGDVPCDEKCDVLLTPQKALKAKCGTSIQISLKNKAAEISKDFGYVEISNIEKCKNRIYFRFSNEKTKRSVYTIRNEMRTRCFRTTPTPKGEKIYRTNGWFDPNGFTLEHDDECNLYYIERS